MSASVEILLLGAVLSAFWVLAYRFVPVPGTTLMGVRAMEGETISKQWTSLDDISPHLVRAVMAGEDLKFCRHIGFDFGEIKAALEDARRGEGLRGASTISQQTAKNAFLWPSRGPIRKLLEAWFTGLEEVIWSKSRIMEVYLNIAEWGGGAFGAEAAAQKYFGKSAKNLSIEEASLLASVLPSPNKWSVSNPTPFIKGRSQKIQRKMSIAQSKKLDSCLYP